MRRFIFSLTQMLALLLAAPALAAEAPPVRPAPSTGMVPAIAKGNASELYSGRPDRTQISEQLRQNAR